MSFIQASRKTYTCLDFSAAKRAVSKSTLRAYLSRCGENVREAVLFRFSHDLALSALLRRCQQLSILRVYRSQITPNALLKETRILPNLTVLATDLRFSMDGFRGMLKGCPSLCTFECSGITPTSRVKAFNADLQRLKIWDESFTPDTRPPSSLVELSVS